MFEDRLHDKFSGMRVGFGTSVAPNRWLLEVCLVGGWGRITLFGLGRDVPWGYMAGVLFFVLYS
jgi:hypothetical protein